MERIKVDNKKYKVASLFAGIGGLDLGFEFAGFDVVWDKDRVCSQQVHLCLEKGCNEEPGQTFHKACGLCFGV